MSSVPYPNPQAVFYQQYESVRRDEVVGVLFALFLGAFGVHHFYLRRTGLGILYLCFFWTGITSILGVIECFFMPGRVRQYNAAQAYYISTQILASPNQPASFARCDACGNLLDPAAIFCTHCGASVLRTSLNTQPV